MSKRVLVAHAVSVLIACCLLVRLYLSPLLAAHVDASQVVTRTSMAVFAGIGAFSGFWLMANRQRKHESLVLATSTLAAVFLLIMALEMPIQVV